MWSGPQYYTVNNIAQSLYICPMDKGIDSAYWARSSPHWLMYYLFTFLSPFPPSHLQTLL